jgi:hypothetical protein
MNGEGLILQPRLGLTDGFIRVYQPATDRYAAYRYDWDQDVVRFDYGTNVAGPILLKLLTLRPEKIINVTLDGQPVGFNIETVGNDTYLALSGPSGEHRLEIVARAPSIEPLGGDTTPGETSSAASDSPNPELPPESALPTWRPPMTGPDHSALARPVEGPNEAQTVPAGPGPGITQGWEGRLKLVHFVGTGLVVVSGLGLIALITFRSRPR